ncbi:MAG: zinc-finger domain-containing protein [Caulobacteraceae bacterium]|nr:zinc-finger domain-containing protein [Caulobacter sp.]
MPQTRPADLLTADAHRAEDQPEIVPVDTHRVWCDGGEGALGHPRVYMEMGAAGFVECPYCDRRFVLRGHEKLESQRLDPADYQGAAGA